MCGDLAPFDLDGHPVDWMITGLAVRGLIGFDPLLPSPAHLTRRGVAALHPDNVDADKVDADDVDVDAGGRTDTGAGTRRDGTHPRRRRWSSHH